MQTQVVPYTTRLRILFRKFACVLFSRQAAAEARILRNVDAREARVRENDIYRGRVSHDSRQLAQATDVAYQNNCLPSGSYRRSERGYTSPESLG